MCCKMSVSRGLSGCLFEWSLNSVLWSWISPERFHRVFASCLIHNALNLLILWPFLLWRKTVEGMETHLSFRLQQWCREKISVRIIEWGEFETSPNRPIHKRDKIPKNENCVIYLPSCRSFFCQTHKKFEELLLCL